MANYSLARHDDGAHDDTDAEMPAYGSGDYGDGER